MLDKSPNYFLRLSLRAARDREEIRMRQEDMEGEATAEAWNAAFWEAFGSLATNPRRYAVPTDANGFTGEVQAITFRRETGTVPYRLIYKGIEDSDEGRQAQLLHVRHAAARPMTRKESREIEAQSRE